MGGRLLVPRDAGKLRQVLWVVPSRAERIPSRTLGSLGPRTRDAGAARRGRVDHNPIEAGMNDASPRIVRECEHRSARIGLK